MQYDPTTDSTRTDLNRDPITGTPGSHPVGVGAGAAAGGITGAAVGAVGGPVGMAVGAAIGSVAGGLLGKSAAEAVNPTGEVEYWRGEFANRPYSQGYQFSDFEPAYYSTAAAYPTYAGRAFEEVEPHLERAWVTNRRSSSLDWSKARNASKDAWERVATRYAQRTPTSETEQTAARSANDLVAMLHDAKYGFQQAAENVKDPSTATGLRRFAQQRESFITELKPMIATRGETPDDSGTTLGSLHRGWIGLKSVLTSGDYSILAECERGEDSAVAHYRKVLQSSDLTPELRRTIERQYAEVQQAHDTVRTWRDRLANKA
jgi:uncharacterized protein (TIGR02284 family)